MTTLQLIQDNVTDIQANVQDYGNERYADGYTKGHKEGLEQGREDAIEDVEKLSDRIKWDFLVEKLKEVADGYVTVHDLFREAQLEQCHHMPSPIINGQTLLIA